MAYVWLVLAFHIIINTSAIEIHLTRCFLCLDFEDLEVPSSSNEEDGSTREFVANAEDGVVTLSSEHFWQLQKKAQELAATVS